MLRPNVQMDPDATGSRHVPLTDDARDLLRSIGPEVLLQFLAGAVDLATTEDELRLAIEQIEATPNTDFIVVAVYGTDRTATALGLYPELIRRLRRGGAKVNADGLLDVPGLLDLGGIPKNTSIQALCSVKGGLLAQGTERLSLPNLRHVGDGLRAHGSIGLSLPSLETVLGELNAERAKGLFLPNLRVVGHGLDVRLTDGLVLPSLEVVGRMVRSKGARGLSLPRILSLNGKKVDGPEAAVPNMEQPWV